MPIFTRSRLRVFRPTLFFAFRFSALAIHRRIRKEVQRDAVAGAGWICEGGWACELRNPDEAISTEPLRRIGGDQREAGPLC